MAQCDYIFFCLGSILPSGSRAPMWPQPSSLHRDEPSRKLTLRDHCLGVFLSRSMCLKIYMAHSNTFYIFIPNPGTLNESKQGLKAFFFKRKASSFAWYHTLPSAQAFLPPRPSFPPAPEPVSLPTVTEPPSRQMVPKSIIRTHRKGYPSLLETGLFS